MHHFSSVTFAHITFRVDKYLANNIRDVRRNASNMKKKCNAVPLHATKTYSGRVGIVPLILSPAQTVRDQPHVLAPLPLAKSSCKVSIIV